MKLAQGSSEYPLLFSAQRSNDWPGLPAWGHLAYETEYYVFDPARPLIRLHFGRALESGLHYTDYSLSDQTRALFPPMPTSAPSELLSNIQQVVAALKDKGARDLNFPHPRIHKFLLPGGTQLTFNDFSGTGHTSPYVQIELQPTAPLTVPHAQRLPAFPGAQGFGSYSTGGRGGKVYVVTTLDDYLSERRDARADRTIGEEKRDGTIAILPGFPALPAEAVIHGSLRDAVEAKGPRIILFAVSGTIELKAMLKIRNPYITIAANTAPGEGVQIRNWGIEIQTHDVVLRHLRVRVGDIKGPGKMPRVLGEQTHALDISGLNIVIDHCEFAYANDQLVNIYAQRTPASRTAVTFQWNYIYGGLTNSVHEGGNHSHAFAFGGWGFASLHHNLTAFALGRNPRISSLQVDFRNNVLHHFWDSGYGDGGDDSLKLNYIASVLQHGQRRQAFFDSKHLSGQFFASDNIRRNLKRKGPDRILDVPATSLLNTPFEAPPVDTHPPLEAYDQILQKGGANLPVRDAITQFVARSVRENSGKVAGKTDDWPFAGYPQYPPATAPPDTDKDGIPDDWENKFSSNPNDPADSSSDPDRDGYTNVEEFINGTNPREA